MCFVHELKQFIDDSLQEFPMRLEKTRVLPHNVHDIRRYNGFVVLASLDLAETQEVFYDGDQEPFFGLFVYMRHQSVAAMPDSKYHTHRARNRTDSPTQGVEVLPRPFGSINLFCKLLSQNDFSV
jgi:hypothetical protein